MDELDLPARTCQKKKKNNLYTVCILLIIVSTVEKKPSRALSYELITSLLDSSQSYSIEMKIKLNNETYNKSSRTVKSYQI